MVEVGELELIKIRYNFQNAERERENARLYEGPHYIEVWTLKI